MDYDAIVVINEYKHTVDKIKQLIMGYEVKV